MLGKKRSFARALTTLISLLALALVPALASGADTGLKQRSCETPSPVLTSVGVRCAAAKKIALKAVDKSNCPPRPDFRGCFKTVKVKGWTCHGLFPGEGESFTCRLGDRRIHFSGGG